MWKSCPSVPVYLIIGIFFLLVDCSMSTEKFGSAIPVTAKDLEAWEKVYNKNSIMFSLYARINKNMVYLVQTPGKRDCVS